MHQIGKATAAMALALIAIVAPATPVWAAAEPVITVEEASIMWSPVDMIIYGHATCSQPTGQAQIEVFVLQLLGNGPSAQGSTTITCGPGPVPWSMTATSYNGAWVSGNPLAGNAALVRNGTPEAYTCACVTAW